MPDYQTMPLEDLIETLIDLYEVEERALAAWNEARLQVPCLALSLPDGVPAQFVKAIDVVIQVPGAELEGPRRLLPHLRELTQVYAENTARAARLHDDLSDATSARGHAEYVLGRRLVPGPRAMTPVSYELQDHLPRPDESDDDYIVRVRRWRSACAAYVAHTRMVEGFEGERHRAMAAVVAAAKDARKGRATLARILEKHANTQGAGKEVPRD